MAENNTPAAPPAKKGKLKLIILLALVVVLAVGLSVVGTLWFLGGGLPGSGESDDASEASAEVFRPSVYLDIDKALVTTVQAEGGGRQRYAQVHVSLEAESPQTLEAAELHLPLVRSQLVSLLANSDFMELQTPQGRTALADNMLASINQVLEQEGEAPLKGVLFRNFVVQ
ncbi:MAG: flagellar basal body-associated FliL family protein [Pseudomonadota bacterium]